MGFRIYRPSEIGGEGFLAYRISPPLLGAPCDPYLSIDLFELSQPTFRPHPHAGLVSATYLFPESPGTLRCRDSLGGDFRLRPGEFSWSAAGRGLIHEEAPYMEDAPATGAQFLVNMPRESELDPPLVLHYGSESIPVQGFPWGRARVLCGEMDGGEGPASGGATLLVSDIEVDEGAELSLSPPSGSTGFAFLRSGRLSRGGDTVLPMEALVPGPSPLLWRAGPGTRLMLFQGVPLQEPVEHFGPFAMSDRFRNQLAARSYRSGAMGELEPSF
jgi:redox-sensitive bicupin YhaK (pirin superfamily)